MQVEGVGARHGRDDMEMRPAKIKMGVSKIGGLGKVEGSASWMCGKTIVVAEIKGPEVTSAISAAESRRDIEVAVKAVVKPTVGLITEREHEIEEKIVRYVQGILDFSCPPRTAITTIVQVRP